MYSAEDTSILGLFLPKERHYREYIYWIRDGHQMIKQQSEGYSLEWLTILGILQIELLLDIIDNLELPGTGI